IRGRRRRSASRGSLRGVATVPPRLLGLSTFVAGGPDASLSRTVGRPQPPAGPGEPPAGVVAKGGQDRAHTAPCRRTSARAGPGLIPVRHPPPPAKPTERHNRRVSLNFRKNFFSPRVVKSAGL